MLNKLQAIIKNMIITVYCLARSAVGVLVLRASQASRIQRSEDPQRGSALISGLVTPLRGRGGSGGGGILPKEDRDPGEGR